MLPDQRQLPIACLPAGPAERQPYEPPAVVYDTQMSTRAGSPVSAFRPEQDPADLWSK